MIDFEKGIMNRGSWFRLRNAFQRAAAGETVTVGFLGGSITQGSLASRQENCYASLVGQWFAEQFPVSRFINAGIGGTTSQFGAARVEQDLLAAHPDVVFIEFSVNDENTPHFQETYEGLVRRVLCSGAAVVLIHNIMYNNGVSAEQIHLAVGRHYGLPCVSMKSTIYPEVVSGRLPNRQITPDDLHPNDEGHALVAQAVICLLEKALASDAAEEELPLPEPLTANAYEHSTRYQNTNSQPELAGFSPDYTPQEHITQMFRRGYNAWKPGDRITITVEGTGVAVQYRKSVHKPAPIARVVVDGDERTACLLDANFAEDWGDCLYIDTVLAHGVYGRHTVEITLTDTGIEPVVPFYLVSVIGSY